MDVKFIDASEWVKLEWYNQGGTRAKRVLQSPDDAEWYFKCSEKKAARGNNPEKYYRYEFWSEIIAYQLGKLLGLNILRYDIAIHENQIGCLSPLMIKRDEEQLIEVGRYMTSLNLSFLPEDNSTRREYTFQLLEQTINEFKLTQYWPQFFQTLLFDAIIGNTDRHQENWAFLGKITFINESLRDVNGQRKLQLTNLVSMAPIYDSGSSLARELTDEKVVDLLGNEAALNKYIINGKAEIHWQNKKLSHFVLMNNLLNSSYLEQVIEAGSFLSKWDDEKVKEIINGIDKDLPSAWHLYCIPQPRKDLIIKLLILRSQKLKSLLNDRV